MQQINLDKLQSSYPIPNERRPYATWITIALFLITIIGVMVCIRSISSQFGRTITGPTINYPIQATPQLVLHIQNSPVSIHSGSGQSITIQATKHIDIFDGNTSNSDMTSYQKDTTITVATQEEHFPSLLGSGSAYVSLDITVPTNCNIQITGSGDITIDTVNGKVAANISAGNIEMDHVSGQMDLHTLNGTMTANDTNGQTTLDTKHGEIKATHAQLTGRSSINTLAGNIVFNGSLAAPGNTTLHANAGNITVTLPANETVAIHASVARGLLSNAFADLPANSSSTAEIRSDAGNVTINKS